LIEENKNFQEKIKGYYLKIAEKEKREILNTRFEEEYNELYALVIDKKKEFDNLVEKNKELTILIEKYKEELTNIRKGEEKERLSIFKNMQNEINSAFEKNILLVKENILLKNEIELKDLKMDKITQNFIDLKNSNNQLEDDFVASNQKLEEIKEKYETIKEEKRKLRKINSNFYEILRLKRGEVQCLEALHYTGSETLKKYLEQIRKNEQNLIKK
jgi:hypothetical protein